MKLFETPNDGIEWCKASFCFSGECVEIAQRDGAILMRSTRQPDRVLELTREEWLIFAKGLSAGEFDHIARASAGHGASAKTPSPRKDTA